MVMVGGPPPARTPYSAKYLADPLGVARRRSLFLPDDSPGVALPRTALPALTVGNLHGTNLSGGDYRVSDVNGHGLVWAKMQIKPDDVVEGKAPMARRKCLSLAIGGNALDPECFQCYYLPWDKDGGAVSLTLGGGADLFFTASLSGCSVVVRPPPVGPPPQYPTVFHCGQETMPVGTNAVQVWEDLVDHITGGAAVVGIDKTAYVKDGGTAGQTTARSLQLEADVVVQYPIAVNEMALPFGAVFGMRDPIADTWSFFLQENALVSWQRTQVITTTKKFLMFKKNKHVNLTTTTTITRPIQVTRFYPAPPAAPLARTWPWPP